MSVILVYCHLSCERMLETKADRQDQDTNSRQELLWVSVGSRPPSAVRDVECDLRADTVH